MRLNTHINVTISFILLVLNSVPSIMQQQSLPITGTLTTPRVTTTDDEITLTLEDFVAQVIDGDADAIRGVYVQDVLALPVFPQPMGNSGFVTNQPNNVTQFQDAALFDVIGLVAHNYLAGREFSTLDYTQEVNIVYGDGFVSRYQITEIRRYQALDSNNPYSPMRDLATDETFSSTDAFADVYMGDHHVTFQTCIAKDGNLTWGRLFVIAEPVN